MYGIGFGLDVSIRFSSVKDTIENFGDLLARDNHILRSKLTILLTPPSRRVKNITSAEDFGLTLVAEWKEHAETYDRKVKDKTAEVLELAEKYGIRLLYDWDSIQRQYWDIPLSELQKQVSRDRIFREEGKDFKVISLSWDTDKNEYALLYHEYIQREKAPTHVNDPKNRVEHSFFTSVANEIVGIDSWVVKWLS
jgi:hypothetical protein